MQKLLTLTAAAAFAVAQWLGVAPEKIVERLRSFAPLTGRTRLIKLSDVLLVDDAYNANPASMAAVVDALRDGASGRRVLVMGDMLELGDASESFHRKAIGAVFASGIEVLVAVGTVTGRAALAIQSAAQTRVILCEDAAAASDAVVTLVEPGDTVWVKGSRAMGLDRVVDELRTRLGAKAAVA